MRSLCCVMLTLLAVGSGVRGQNAAKSVTVKKTAAGLEFYAGDELVTRYHTSATYTKPIFWPVNAAGGVPLTRDWPMVKGTPGESTDHLHQKSAWFCHGDVIPEGVDLTQHVRGVEGVDFWSEAPGHGVIACTKVEEPHKTKDGVAVKTHNEWRTADGVKILDEDRTIHFVDLGKARLVVVDCNLAAGKAPIVFADTKEGAFGIRINDQIVAGPGVKGKVDYAGKIQNAEGKIGEKDCWGRISAWCDYSGPIGGKEVGLAILADPKNPSPTCWHVRGYGLMAANPFGRTKAGFPDTRGKKDLVRIPAGGTLRFRYGLLLHEGDAGAGQVARHFERFVELRDRE